MAKSRKSYSLTFKLEVIRYADAHSLSSAARKYKIDRKMIREWNKNREDITTQALRKTRRRVRRIRASKWPNLENDLHEWIMQLRLEGRCVTGNMVKQQALEMSGNLEFSASNGWLKFS